MDCKYGCIITCLPFYSVFLQRRTTIEVLCIDAILTFNSNMSLIECVRDECGKIMQNRNGQYFFVCSKCDLEFVTLWSFLDHLNDSHDSKDFRNQSDDLTIPFTKKLPYGRTRITGSEDAIIFEREDVRDIKVENNSSDMFTDDCSEPVHKANAVLRTVSKSEPRRAILVSPKPKKPARRVALGKSFILRA